MSPVKHDVWRYDPETVTSPAQLVTQALLDACALQASDRVLDLACGGGNPSIHIASSVATAGLVVAADLEMGGLVTLAAATRNRGIGNLFPSRCSSDHLPFPSGCFDVATCRFGAMFFADFHGSLAELHRVLKSGARLGFAVYGPKQSNSLYVEAEAAIADVGLSAEHCSQRIFRFSDDRILEDALTTTGFGRVRATDIVGLWDRTGDVQISHLLQRTYQPAIAALGDRGGPAFVADLRRRLMRKRDAGEFTWRFRIVSCER